MTGPTPPGGPGYRPAPPGYGYPPQQKPVRVSTMWTGALLTLGGLAAAVGSLLTWVHAVVAGGGPSTDFSAISGDRGGKVTVVFGALLLIGGLLILVKQGRIWRALSESVYGALVSVSGRVSRMGVWTFATSATQDCKSRRSPTATG
jgi:hypothetical protein